ncbi:MAG: NAD(P)/FAD-dependent oxidoreductase [Anaerolineales bacterium]|nr:NAD(P)/FAD-dependent oxidoreductase [Anaerolineales bacterium]
MKHSVVMIVGGGPAGMTAAIQLRRYGFDPLVFESKRLGGLLWNANLVENYPGFPGGISGPELVKKISQQFSHLGIRMKRQQIERVDYDGEIFTVESKYQSFTCDVLVLAAGTKPNQFPSGLIPDEAASRVYYEVSDLADRCKASIAIIGAGDAAFDYALNLASWENEVMIFNRGTEIKALPLLLDRVLKFSSITYYQNTSLNAVQSVEGKLQLGMVDVSGKTSYKVDALLGALGRSPTGPHRTERLSANLAHLQENGRLHLVGDLHNGIYRQTAIAVGDGLKAAMKIYQFLRGEDEQ